MIDAGRPGWSPRSPSRRPRGWRDATPRAARTGRRPRSQRARSSPLSRTHAVASSGSQISLTRPRAGRGSTACPGAGVMSRRAKPARRSVIGHLDRRTGVARKREQPDGGTLQRDSKRSPPAREVRPCCSPRASAAFYRENGYLIVEDVLTPDQVAEGRRVIEGFVERSRASPSDDVFDLEPAHTPERPAIRRLKAPHRNHPFFDGLIRSDAILDPLESVLGPNIRMLGSKLNLKSAGVGSPVEWHQDLAFHRTATTTCARSDRVRRLLASRTAACWSCRARTTAPSSTTTRTACSSARSTRRGWDRRGHATPSRCRPARSRSTTSGCSTGARPTGRRTRDGCSCSTWPLRTRSRSRSRSATGTPTTRERPGRTRSRRGSSSSRRPSAAPGEESRNDLRGAEGPARERVRRRGDQRQGRQMSYDVELVTVDGGPTALGSAGPLPLSRTARSMAAAAAWGSTAGSCSTSPSRRASATTSIAKHTVRGSG